MADPITVEQVQALVREHHFDTIAVRRHLHAHPELSFQEHLTGRYIADRLRAMGLAVRTGIAGTGVIGVLQGRGAGRTVCLRADIDALPIQEKNALPHASRNPGVMHACGHDAHTAMVLAAGRVLHELRGKWNGTVLLLFQPGEEKIPGGASLVLKEGALSDPAPDAILGQHVTPELEVGKVGFHAGPFMASSDELYLTVKGKGGHAAQPEKLIDPIQIAARLLIVLKDECKAWAGSRPLVLGFGRVLADGATNVVPDEVQIAGTLRTFDEELRAEAHEWLVRKADALCRSHGGSCAVEVRKGYPVLVNDEPLTERMRAAAAEFLGADQVVEMPQRMGSEDFAFYSQVMPASFHRLGTGNPQKGPAPGLHTPAFDLPDESLAIGTGVLVWGALKEMRGA
ncbi:MAG: amidohydrolase [Flavobacteriales bacterium]|nr:amidohydrolase [Flavobacteriales bacterium]MEB2342422.1 M20 family metallopeptidase [Flavobacteriia bacterium]